MPAFINLVPSKRKSEGEPDNPQKKQNTGCTEDYWLVQWRTPQTRKHKSWNGDGVLHIVGTSGTLYDSEGTRMGSGKVEPPFSEGVGYSNIGGKEIELERQITRAEYMSGQCFGSGSTSTAPAVTSSLGSAAKQYIAPKPTVPPKRPHIPLQPVSLLSSNADSSTEPETRHFHPHWSVNLRKMGHTNKNRPWDGDAYISLSDKRKLTLISEKGKNMGTANHKGEPLITGARFFISGYEVQLDTKVPSSRIPGSNYIEIDDEPEPSALPQAQKKFVSPASFYGAAPPKLKPAAPLHDPDEEGAIVMKAPTKEHIKRFNKENRPIVPVVLDPVLSQALRPHQVEGVKFLYECVMGIRKHEGQGCILADDMGLGKTLQTILLIWTLLRQNPYAHVGPVVEKVMIVCPVSLVNNWRSEFQKWLGKDRVRIAVCDSGKVDNVIAGYMNSKNIPILIIGYERLRTIIDRLTVMVPPIGLIICDEGHRLKSASNKTNKMFSMLKTPRRIILSGTPIQNDLSELHAMADFCNPGLLDDYSTFRKVYETPILKSRTPDSTSKEVEIGEARSERLSEITRSFVLRREAKLLHKYLPPKYEYVVFVKATSLQREIFNTIVNPDKVSADDLASGPSSESLALIGMLTKISNDPILLRSMVEKDIQQSASYRMTAAREAVKLIPDHARFDDVNLSGKLMALAKLLKTLRQATEEKCVIVSHYTSTLNILEAYCKKKGYSFFRLDGQTQAAKRQEFVNRFNKSTQKECFLFLLSSKAGGVGLNLIGASRLCLLDSDWNPSHDLQSMARCHRDGQKRPVHIYRFMTAGTIDEKIFQRQVTKLGLSNSLIGSESANSKMDSFTRKELRDIFTVNFNSPSNTHDLIECPCTLSPEQDVDGMDVSNDNARGDEDDGSERRTFMSAAHVKPKDVNKVDKAYLQKKKAQLASLGEWQHINCLSPSCWAKVEDVVLQRLLHWKEDPNKEDEGLKRMSLLQTLDSGRIKQLCDVPLQDLKGGTVGFVFKKVTTAQTSEEDEEAEEKPDLEAEVAENYNDE